MGLVCHFHKGAISINTNDITLLDALSHLKVSDHIIKTLVLDHNPALTGQDNGQSIYDL